MSEPLNLSGMRDKSVLELYDYFLKSDITKERIQRAEKDAGDMGDWGYYNSVGTRRIIITRELTRRMGYARAVIKEPTMIFRDIQEQPNTGQRFAIEYYLGRFTDAGKIFFSSVRVIQSTVHNVSVARSIDELPEILMAVNGIEVYRAFKN